MGVGENLSGRGWPRALPPMPHLSTEHRCKAYSNSGALLRPMLSAETACAALPMRVFTLRQLSLLAQAVCHLYDDRAKSSP